MTIKNSNDNEHSNENNNDNQYDNENERANPHIHKELQIYLFKWETLDVDAAQTMLPNTAMAFMRA